MKRDKALGHDPLGWIKATREAEARQESAESKSEESASGGPEEQEESSRLEATHTEIKENPQVEEPQPVQKTIETRQERIHIIPGRDYTTIKEGFVEGRTKMPSSTARTNGSTIIFIIVYAVLLLVLTLFVYFNLSKRMDGMSSRISNIEKALTFLKKGEPKTSP